MKYIFLCILLIGFSSCDNGGKDPSTADNTKDRQEILTFWADEIIIPSYENFEVKFNSLQSGVNTFVAAPTVQNLTTLRSKWSDAYHAWQRVELFEFGPADNNTLRNFFNIYPADVIGIQTAFNDPSSSLDFPATYPRQGFPALDYLINGVATGDEQIVAYYLDGTNGAKRKAYMTRLIDRMDLLFGNVLNDWKGSYRGRFIASTGLDIGSSFGIVVNNFVLHYERYIRSGKIGIPSGATISLAGVKSPEKVEAFYKNDISKSLALEANDAAADFFNGVSADGQTGPSLKSYLDALGAKDAASGTLLSSLITQQFSIVENQLQPLSPSFYNQVQTNNQPLLNTFASMQQLVRLLKVDMTSQMSITITYTDNDGD